MKYLPIIATLSVFVGAPAHALTFTLDFDMPNGTVVTGPGGLGTGTLTAIEVGNPTNVIGTVGVSVQEDTGSGYIDGYGVVFDTSVSTNSDNDLQGSPFTAGSTAVAGVKSAFGSHTKTLIIQNMGQNPAGCASGLCTTPNDNAAGGIIRFDFSSLVPGGIRLDEIPLFEFESTNRGIATAIFQLSDGSSLTLDSHLLEDAIGNDASGTVDVDVFLAGYGGGKSPTNVVGLDLIYYNSGSIGFDGFIAEINTTTVPVPASLPLLLAGVAGVGIASRRRRR